MLDSDVAKYQIYFFTLFQQCTKQLQHIFGLHLFLSKYRNIFKYNLMATVRMQGNDFVPDIFLPSCTVNIWTSATQWHTINIAFYIVV